MRDAKVKGSRSSGIRRVLLGGLVFGILLLGAIGYVDAFLRLPVGEGPAGPPVDAGRFKATWTDRPVRLLALGDSITAGFGASRGLSYVDRLVKNPDSDFPEMSGCSLSVVIPNLYGASYSQAIPWIRAFEKRLDQMLNAIEGAFPGGCQVFLANVYDPTDDGGNLESAGLPPWPDARFIHGEYNQILARAADQRRNVHLVDLYAAFLGHGIHCRQWWHKHYRPADPHYWYGANLEDPNDRGYDAVRRLFLNEISRVFGESRSPAP